MAQSKRHIDWHSLVAVTTAVIAVLAAIASFRSSADASLMLLEKNNASLYQNQANKAWNSYLADNITSRVLKTDSNDEEQRRFQNQATELENKVTEATNKSHSYFEKNSNLSTAGTFLEVGIALSAMSILIKRKSFWIFSLLLAGVGVYFLAVGLL